jgi:hypothetical protein
VNVDSLKEVISVDVCNITEAFFWNNEGNRYKLTQEPVYVHHIQAMELTCNVPTSTSIPSPTPNSPTPSASKKPEPSKTLIPKPSVKPSATATPEPRPTSKKENDKYAYFKIACIVVAVIAAVALIVKIVKRCRSGRTVTFVDVGVEYDRLDVVPQDQEEAQQGQQDQVQVEVLQDQEEARYAIGDADLDALRQAVDGKGMKVIVETITRLYGENLAGSIPEELREGVYGCLKSRLRELAAPDKDWHYNEPFIFLTLVRAVARIGLYERLMAEDKEFYLGGNVASGYFEYEIIDKGFDDVVELQLLPNSFFLFSLLRAVANNGIGEIVWRISLLYSDRFLYRLSGHLRECIYDCLKKRLLILAGTPWPNEENEKDRYNAKGVAFATLVRAVNRIGLYERLMAEDKEFYDEKGVKFHFFKLKNLTDRFRDTFTCFEHLTRDMARLQKENVLYASLDGI